MKKIIQLPIIILTILFFASSCDYVDWEDNQQGNSGNTKDTVRKILIEDFTGHECVNCPSAHQTGHDIIAHYGNQVVFVAIHAGYFSEPSNPPFDYDFRTAMGTEIHDQYGVTLVPTGMVNRTPKNGSTNMLIPFGDWSSEASRHIDSLSEEPDAYIHLDVNYNQSSHSIDVDAEVTFFTPSAQSRKYNLVVAVTEDEIIKPQKSGSTEIHDYEHNHVLRGSLNGTWGEEIHEGVVSTMQKFQKSYTGYSLGSDWDADNCNVIAYLYYNDGTTDKPVIQAQEVSVK